MVTINRTVLCNEIVPHGLQTASNFSVTNYSNNTFEEFQNGSHFYGYHDIEPDYDIEFIQRTTKLLRNIWIPSIVLIGLIGNTLSLLVFSARNMKHSSSSTFLAALALVDNVFLLNLGLIWIDGEFYNILRFPMACEMIMFVTYVTAFLSVWFVVGFTTERFVAICFPLRSHLLCTVSREKVTVIIMTITACLIYNHSFWTIDIVLAGPRYRCVLKQEMVSYLQVITWVDTLLTMIAPFFLITFMNIQVLIAAAFCHTKTQSCCCASKSKSIGYSGISKSRKTLRFISQLRVTRTLVLVSTTFLVLNLPSHTLRLYSLIYTATHPQDQFIISIQLYFIQEIANFLYYTTFSCNFVLYSVYGKHFQKNLKMMLKCSSVFQEEREQRIRRLSSLRTTTMTHTGTSV